MTDARVIETRIYNELRRARKSAGQLALEKRSLLERERREKGR